MHEISKNVTQGVREFMASREAIASKNMLMGKGISK